MKCGKTPVLQLFLICDIDSGETYYQTYVSYGLKLTQLNLLFKFLKIMEFISRTYEITLISLCINLTK